MTQLKGAQVTWLGHATFKVTTPQNKVILIDPWIEGNPKSPAQARQLDKVDLILVTHGHSDHIWGKKRVIPMHYGTFPILIGTPAQLKDELHKLGLESVEVVEMTPGQTIA